MPLHTIDADGHGTQETGPCQDSTAWIGENAFVDNEIGVLSYFLSRAVLANNVFVNNRAAVVANHHGDSVLLALNNTLYGNDSDFALQASYSHLINNIMAVGGGLVHEYVQTGKYQCNLFWQASLGRASDVDNFSADPMFLAPEQGDLRLQAGSPGYDAGCFSDALFEADGSAPDLGARGGPFAAP